MLFSESASHIAEGSFVLDRSEVGQRHFALRVSVNRSVEQRTFLRHCMHRSVLRMIGNRDRLRCTVEHLSALGESSGGTEQEQRAKYGFHHPFLVRGSCVEIFKNRQNARLARVLAWYGQSAYQIVTKLSSSYRVGWNESRKNLHICGRRNSARNGVQQRRRKTPEQCFTVELHYSHTSPGAPGPGFSVLKMVPGKFFCFYFFWRRCASQRLLMTCKRNQKQKEKKDS